MSSSQHGAKRSHTMGEASESTTPRSAAEPQLKAAKDKSCPFCGQNFTSSSLGRHLDLYIRPKNPKSADGIHLVDEIRKLRGGITRRQAKGSVSGPKTDGSRTSTPGSKKQSIVSAGSSARDDSPGTDDDELHVGKTRSHFSDVRWGDVRRDVSRPAQRAALEQRSKTSEAVEIASATEMALRELLKSVREASAKTAGAGLFDFDPYALNFPSLCLEILSAPATLFSPTPFATPDSWATTPPGPKQLEALHRQVRERLLAQQRQRQISHVYPSGVSDPASPLPTPPLFDPDPQRLFGHIADAYSHWSRQTDKTRQECWQTEILRCYVRADDRRCEAEVQLENARREIEHLKASRWTSGAPEPPVITINLGSGTVTELGKYGMDFRNWDYDRLIDKWRGLIREGRAGSGMAAQKPLPGGHVTSRSGSVANQPLRPLAPASSERSSPVKTEAVPFAAGESDQMDAEGDDDDIALDQHTPPDDGAMMQRPPQQHSQHQIHPSQQLQSHMPMHLTQTQMHARANAHAQAWAAARQHMNQSRNQIYSPHMQQIHSHLGSAESSRRPSLQMMDPHAMQPTGMNSAMNMATGMEGLENHPDQFLRLDMGFVGSNDHPPMGSQ